MSRIVFFELKEDDYCEIDNCGKPAKTVIRVIVKSFQGYDLLLCQEHYRRASQRPFIEGLKVKRSIKKETDWVFFEEHGLHCRIKAEYGLEYIQGNEDSYVFVTGTIESRKSPHSRWKENCVGSIHEEVSKFFPPLKVLIPFHLCHESGVPLHYLANGEYWYERAQGGLNEINKEAARRNFASTIVYGVLPGETSIETATNDWQRPWSEISVWLGSRLPLLKQVLESILREVL